MFRHYRSQWPFRQMDVRSSGEEGSPHKELVLVAAEGRRKGAYSPTPKTIMMAL